VSAPQKLAAMAIRRRLIQLHTPSINPMTVVKRRVSTLTVNQQAHLLEPYRVAINALQFGQFNEAHFRMLADCFNVAEALAQPLYNLANDHIGKFQDGLHVLEQLAGQYRTSKSWTARAGQLQAVKDAQEIHEIQLQHVSQAELLDAAALVVRRVHAALAGHGGCTVVEALS